MPVTQLTLKGAQELLIKKEKELSIAEHDQHKLMRKTAITGLAIIGLIALSITIFALPFSLAAGAIGAGLAASHTLAVAGSIGGSAIVLTFIGTITALILGERSKKQTQLKNEIRELKMDIMNYQGSRI